MDRAGVKAAAQAIKAKREWPDAYRVRHSVAAMMAATAPDQVGVPAAAQAHLPAASGFAVVRGAASCGIFAPYFERDLRR